MNEERKNCKGCPDRHVGCHSRCEIHLKNTEKRKAEMQHRLREQEAENCRIESMRRIMRRKGK